MEKDAFKVEECSISISGQVPEEPEYRVKLMATVAEAICKVSGVGPADAMMMLMTAAAVVLVENAKDPMSTGELESVLAQGVGHAARCASEMLPDQVPTVQ